MVYIPYPNEKKILVISNIYLTLADSMQIFRFDCAQPRFVCIIAGSSIFPDGRISFHVSKYLISDYNPHEPPMRVCHPDTNPTPAG